MLHAAAEHGGADVVPAEALGDAVVAAPRGSLRPLARHPLLRRDGPQQTAREGGATPAVEPQLRLMVIQGKPHQVLSTQP